MLFNSTKLILALAATVLLAFGARAQNYNPTPVFTQDFEDAGTYADQITNGSYVWTDTTDVVAGTKTAMSQGTRTDSKGTATKYAKFSRGSQKDVKEGYIFTMPAAAQKVMDYKIEFDWYISSPYATGKPDYTYYQIVGTNDFLMRIEVTYVTDSKLRTVDVLNAAGESVGQITVAGRNSDSSDDKYKEAWNHFIVYGSDIDGVKLDVVGYDGKAVITGATLSPEFDRVKLLSAVMPHKKNSYALNSGLDNVVVYKAIDPRVYIWTGAAGDCKWSTPGNWTVGGVVQTEECPGEYDDAVIAGEGLSITAEVGLAVTRLDLAEGNRLIFDVGGVEKNKQVALVTAKKTISAELTAENVILTGYSSETCLPKMDFSATPMITVIVYDKTKFFWTGNGGSMSFETPANWAYGLADGPVAETAPAGNSTVAFPSSFTDGVTVKFSTDTSGSGIYFVLDCDVTFASASADTRTIYPWSITGSGTLSLANRINIQTVTFKDMSVDVDVNVLPSDGEDPWASYAQFYLRGEKSDITFNGAIKGTGYLSLGGDGNPTKYYYVKGDMGGFSGKIRTQYVWSSSKSDEVNTLRLSSAAALSLGSATLDVNGRVWVTAANDAKTLSVGTLLGTGVIDNRTGDALTLEVGALGADAEASVTLKNNDEGVGAWTVKKVGAGTQTLTNASMTNNVDLVAGELGVPPGLAFGSVALDGGKFRFAIPYDSPWTNGTSCTLFTCTSGVAAGRTVDYVTLDMSAFLAVYDETYDNSQANVLKVSLTPTTAPWVWNGSVNGLWSEASNWLVKGDPAPTPPGTENAVQIGANAVILVEPDQQFGAVTADASATLAVLYTDSKLTFTAPAGFTGTVEAAGPYAATGTAGVFTATRVPSTFTWLVASGNWTDLANWQVGSYPTAVLPGGNDTAVFPSALEEASVTVSSSDQLIRTIAADADLSLVGTKYLRANCICGEGLLTLKGAKVMCNDANLDISNDVCVATGTDNELRMAVDKNSSFYRINLLGNLSGDGNITANHGDRQGAGVAFYGDNNAFAGTFETMKYSYRDATYMDSFISSSSNAVWKVNVLAKNSTTHLFPSADDEYKCFGAYVGNTWVPNGTRLEIGHRDDVESTLYAYSHINYDGNTVRKVGSNVLNLKYGTSGDHNYAVTKVDALYLSAGTVRLDYDLVPKFISFVDGGVLAFSANVRDLSATIADSAAAIAIDDGGRSATWTTALADSNVGGLTKMGAGTLTLTAVPNYAGVTKVLAGRLVVPGGTKVALDATSVADGLQGGEITNVVFSTRETTTLVTTDASTAKVFAAPVDVSNVAVDLSDRTEWTSGSTYYVVSSGGIVVGTSVSNVRLENLTLPDSQKGLWTLGAVELAGKGWVLAVVPVTPGLIVTFE